MSRKASVIGARMKTQSRFSKFAWVFLGYLLFVILYGAWVRITASGAGCGSHWPTCHGEFIPIDPSVETMIEYTHRLTSGLLGILGLVLVGWAWVAHRGRVFWASVITLALILFEALIGAGLVLQELVADDDSVARAIVIALHLANTLILTGSASLVAWWTTDRTELDFRRNRRLLVLCGVGLLALVATSMSGAVTALGDTLFPVDPTVGEGLLQRVRDDLSTANHFLVRLRILHPVIALFSALYILAVTYIVRTRDLAGSAERWALATFVLVLVQTGLGVVNIALAAPGWVQIVHLLTAQLVWIAVVLMTVTVARDN